MRFISTREGRADFTVSEAMMQGMADDGGLFVPKNMPKIDITACDSNWSYPEFAFIVLKPFFKGDVLEDQLELICHEAFNFKIPLKPLMKSSDPLWLSDSLNETQVLVGGDTDTYLLELFHGPTLSFKDVGARFLARCLARLPHKEPVTIMVATSGDTGSAVAQAFYQVNNIEVNVLYPHGKIAKRQEQQITTLGDNIHAYAVKGTFDDCQKLVKAAFKDPEFAKGRRLNTANSINLGRLLPQITYYAYSSMRYYQAHQKNVGIIVPSGNLGNVTAAYWAKLMGFPIGKIVISTNANLTLTEYLSTGKYQPRASIATLANAMDVGSPSNFERLTTLYPSFGDFKDRVNAYAVTDQQIRTAIEQTYHQYGMLICPHTATGVYVRSNYCQDQDILHHACDYIIASTAHPAKFEGVIEPLLGIDIPIPDSLQQVMDKPLLQQVIAPKLEAIDRWR